MSTEQQEILLAQKLYPTKTEIGRPAKFSVPTIESSTGPLPDNFDGRKEWKLLAPSKQGTCGSCWAFATSNTLADRFNIYTGWDVKLSAAKMVLCGFGDEPIGEYTIKLSDTRNVSSLGSRACFGSTLSTAYEYLYLIGTTTRDCVPYDVKLGELQMLGKFQSPDYLPLCADVTGPLADMCSNFFYNPRMGVERGMPGRYFRCLHYYKVPKTEEAIRQEIYQWGPVTTAMEVYGDFYKFSGSGVYEHKGDDDSVGGHAIEIVGWGDGADGKYWIIKNSWGVQWGDGGYFRMRRGTNNCGIEDSVYACVPDLFYPSNYTFPVKLEQDPEIVKLRKEIESPKFVAGGIAPLGYTRRVLRSYPWVDQSVPVAPDWNGFVAATMYRGTTKNLLAVGLVIGVLVLIVAVILIVQRWIR